MTLSPMMLLAVAEALTDLYDEPRGEMGREIERALLCRECGRPIERRVPPSHIAQGRGRYCDRTCEGRAGGKAGKGESKSRSSELRAYWQRKREGKEW